LVLTLFVLCITPVIHSSAVLAAGPGDNELAEATQAEIAGNYQESEKKYREAIEKFKDNKRDHPRQNSAGVLGNLYFKQNQLDKAVDAYENVVEIRKIVLVRGTDDGGAPLSASDRKSVQNDLGLAMMALGSVYTRKQNMKRLKPPCRTRCSQ
jgi:tetratricopeptide (TPR) repeat protein